MKRVARFRLRHLDEERKEDAVQEVLAICWEQYRRLVERGRDPTPFVGKMAEFATRRVRCGRGFLRTRLRDVLSPIPRDDHHVESIPMTEDDDCDPLLSDALADGQDPADEAALKIDVEEWLASVEWRRRRVAELLMSGKNTVEVAKREGVSRMRIFQLRQDLAESCPLLKE